MNKVQLAATAGVALVSLIGFGWSMYEIGKIVGDDEGSANAFLEGELCGERIGYAKACREAKERADEGSPDWKCDFFDKEPD